MKDIEGILGWLDEMLMRLKPRMEARDKITCCAGCSACCKEPVYATRIEAQYMIDSLSPEALAEVKEKLRDWLITAVGSGILLEKEPHVLKYRSLNLWCPLLKNNLCSVYDRRPMGCRLHLAVGPRSACEDDKARAHQKYVSAKELPEMAGAMIVETYGGYSFNHLGILLAEMLLGQHVQNESGVSLVVTP